MTEKMTKDLTHISSTSRGTVDVVSAFTLIELLVVISIIMMLTITAVANFSYVQERMRLDFAADTLVASLREAQVLAKSGRQVKGAGGSGVAGGAAGGVTASAGVLQCYAVKIVSGVAVGSGLYTGQSAYVGMGKVKSGGVGVTSGDQVDICEKINDDKWVKAEIFDGRSIIVGDGNVRTFYFKPPFAQIYTVEGGVLVKAAPKKVEFSVGNAGDLGNKDVVKKVEFDLSSGAVKRG